MFWAVSKNFILQLFRFYVQLFPAIFIKYCAKCKSVIKKNTTKRFQFSSILFNCMKNSYMMDYLRLNVIYDETGGS